MKFVIGILLLVSMQAFAQLSGEFRSNKQIRLDHIRDFKTCKAQPGGRFISNRCYVNTYNTVLIQDNQVDISTIANYGRMCDFSGEISYTSRLTQNVFFARQSLINVTGEDAYCEVLVTKNRDGVDVRVITQDTCTSLCPNPNGFNIQYAKQVRK